VKQAECAILDATVIGSSARLRKTHIILENERHKIKNPSSYSLRKSTEDVEVKRF